jgi:ribosomal protein L37AE/L43A
MGGGFGSDIGMTEDTITVCKFKCPYCDEISVSKRKCSEVRACPKCYNKFVGKKPLVLAEISL